jgi:hypothetical protein
MDTDDLISQLMLIEKLHEEAAAATVGSRTPHGKVSNHVAVRYDKRHHHVIIEGYTVEAKRNVVAKKKKHKR